MIAYAQNAEDVILARALADTSSGFYVDVGAASPNEATVTRHFYEAGWHGVNIEPIPEWAAELRAVRVRDINLEVACAAHDGDLTLYRVLDDPSLSTLDAAVATRHRDSGREVQELHVPVRTLNRILEECKPLVIDFLKIDVEGAELEVLRGIDLERWRPRVIVVEATLPTTLVPNYEDFDEYVRASRYVYASTDGINRYYARAEEADVLVPKLVPANATDDYVFLREYLLLEELVHLRAHVRSLEHQVSLGVDATAAASSPTRPSASTRGASTREGVLVSLDRIAVCTTPATGGTKLAAALAEALGVLPQVADHPADVAFDDLPDRCVLELTWGRTEKLRRTLLSHGFRVVTVRRHPLDTLLAHLRLAQVAVDTSRFLADHSGADAVLVDASPQDPRFLEWAIGPRAKVLLDVSLSWSADPAVSSVHHHALVTTPRIEVDALLQGLGLGELPEWATVDGIETPDVQDVGAGWRSLLSTSFLESVTPTLFPIAERLGFHEPFDVVSAQDESELRRRWATLTQPLSSRTQRSAGEV